MENKDFAYLINLGFFWVTFSPLHNNTVEDHTMNILSSLVPIGPVVLFLRRLKGNNFR